MDIIGHGKVTEIICASSEETFNLVHNYERRLEWDTLLQSAYLTDGATAAREGVSAVCVGRWYLACIALKTTYVSFAPPRLAAVKMVNSPPLFKSWAASLSHRDIGANQSEITYHFHFLVRPHWLKFVLDPLLERIFVLEIKKRLKALNSFFERQMGPVNNHV